MPTHTRPHEDVISLKEVLLTLWQRKLSFLAIIVVFTISAGVAAKILPKTYKATTVLAPVTNQAGSTERQLGSLTSAVSSLASLAGLSVGAENASAQSVAVLQSDFLTEKFIEQNQLLPLLVVQPKHAGGRNSHPAEQPHLWQADQYFKRHILNVATDERTGLVTVTVQWRHPDAAAQWANALVKMTNDYLRQKAIAETERDIAYLKDQAATTDVVGIKGAIYSLLQSQIGRAMLARGSDEYAFKVLDPAIAPAQPDSPQFMIWVLLGFFAGAILAFLCAFALVAWRKS